MKRVLITAAMSLMISAAVAESALPPVWSGVDSKEQFSALTEAYISPTRVVWSDIPDGASIQNIDNLMSRGNGQAELYDGDIVHIETGEAGRVSLLLDFGCQLQGGLQIVTGRSGSKIVTARITLGESVSEAMSRLGDGGGAVNDHAMREFDLDLPWLGVAESGKSGFRFARIDVEGENIDLKIKEIRAVFSYRDIPYRGSFESSDSRLNDIWLTGAYTVHLNMQEYLWDGVKRDRLVWVGDLHPEIMTVNSTFGYNEVVPKSLDVIRDATPVTEWMNGISSYSIWWLLIHQDWYKYQGDRAYLEEQREYMCALLERLMTKVDADGREALDGWLFLDWSSSENEQGIHAGLQSLMVLAMEAGESMMAELGESDMASECSAMAEKMRGYTPDHNGSKQAVSLMALAGLIDPEVANSEVISVGGAADFSTFYGYYMLEAMAKAGDYTTAMQIISDYWGGMLDLGATTFWEDFDMDWLDGAGRVDELPVEGEVDVHRTYGNYCYKNLRLSMCHGWASGPTSWLSRYVLGVQVLEPGCRKLLIEPHLGDLEWVKGSFPTPMGDVVISHKRDKRGNIVSDVTAPQGVEIVIE